MATLCHKKHGEMQLKKWFTFNYTQHKEGHSKNLKTVLSTEVESVNTFLFLSYL